MNKCMHKEGITQLLTENHELPGLFHADFVPSQSKPPHMLPPEPSSEALSSPSLLLAEPAVAPCLQP